MLDSIFPEEKAPATVSGARACVREPGQETRQLGSVLPCRLTLTMPSQEAILAVAPAAPFLVWQVTTAMQVMDSIIR